MKKQKDSKFNIGNITGDVVFSQNQKGGTTAHNMSMNIEEQKKSFFNNKYVLRFGLIGLIASILTILGYFGYRPSNTIDDIIPKEIIQQKNIPVLTTIDTITKETSESQNDTIIKQNATMKKKKIDNEEEKPISIGDVTGDVVISQNQTGGIAAHSINVNEAQRPEWSMGESEKIGENEWRTIFSAKGMGNMAYYNWRLLFTLNTEIIKREDVRGKVSVGPWMPLNLKENLSKNLFFIGYSEFKPGQYFSMYLYSKDSIKVLKTDVLSD